MKKNRENIFSRKGIKRGEIFLGVLVFLALLFQPCLAVLSPNYTAMTQAGRPLDSPGVTIHSDTLAYGDFLFLNDTTWTPGSVGETIVNWKWNLTNLSDPTDSIVINERNVSFGPFIEDGNSYLLNLTVTSSDASQYSPIDTVYQVSDNRDFLFVDYEAVPAYDNRTLSNPNGTITFRDLSYSYVDPPTYTTEWWWKWTDLSTGVSKTLSGQDHFTDVMSITDFMVNLTVNNSLGNLVSITDITPIPPDNVYPIANFSVIPKSGVAPLEIGIIDQALSMVNYTVSDIPLSYNYTIWNETGINVFGTEFTTKNVNVTLKDPGVYHVIQNVTNSFGVSDEYTVGDIVVALPDGPIVNFSASVREGLAPLNVTLIDQTIAAINQSSNRKDLEYFWEIGNNSGYYETSHDPNPQFRLLYPGYNSSDLAPPHKYWVNLTVIDHNGKSNFLRKNDYISVGAERYPFAAFTAVPMNGTYPLNVSFIDQSVFDPDLLTTGVPVKYHWTFDDGTESFIKNPVHTFTSPKDYNVTLHVSHGDLPGSVHSTYQYIHVEEPIDNSINFTWVQEYGKTAYSVVLIPLGINRDWNVDWLVAKGTKTYSSSEFTPRFDLPETGEYTVTMRASRPDGYTTGQKIQKMEVFPNVPPSPEMTMESPFNFGKYQAIAYPNQPIQFWSKASNSMEDSWLWDFGDTYTSNLRSPVHSYNAPGIYEVTLRASNVKGTTSVNNNYNVLILNQISVTPSVNQTEGKAPLTVQFDAKVSINGKSDAESRKYIKKWFWDFDIYTWEGMSSEEKPIYTYTTPGSYTPWVYLYLVNDDITYPNYPVNTITVDPVVPIKSEFTYEEIDRNGSYGYSYKFMDTSQSFVGYINSWDWDFGDGTPNATEPAPTHLYKEPGEYKVILTVRDNAGNEVTRSRDLIVGSTPTPTPTPTPEPLQVNFNSDIKEGFEPLTVKFTDLSTGNPTKWLWDFGDGSKATQKDPVHKYLFKGKYSVSLTCENDAGDKTTELKPDFITVSRIDFAANRTTGNLPFIVELSDLSSIEVKKRVWDYGDGNIEEYLSPGNKTVMHEYKKTGTYPVSLNITDLSGKTIELSKPRYITVTP